MSKRWAPAPCQREQFVLISPSLDDSIPADHEIRLYDKLLIEVDWSDWEAAYDGFHGRPPIHPRLVAGAILYGLARGIRSTRQLEDATRHRIDYLWFLSARNIDHTTFARFRNLFGEELKGLLGDLNEMARELVGASGAIISVDGTRVRGNSDRCGARTESWFFNKLEELQPKLDEALAQLDEEENSSESSETEKELTKRVEQLEREKEKLQRGHDEACKRTEEKRAHDGKNAKEARVPVTDPDARVLPNKEGGHGPNYNPTAAVDAETGLVVAGDVPESADEASSLCGTVAEAEEAMGEPVQKVLCDSNFSSGHNLKELSESRIGVYSPVEAHSTDSSAERPDPTEPVAEDRRDELPKRGGKLDRSAFIYDPEEDCFFCPMGRCLDRHRTVDRKTKQGSSKAVEYKCGDCSDCPLSSQCLSRSARTRRVSLDAFEPYREEVNRRMSTEEGSRLYKKRAPLSEGVFGCIKGAMGIRQFLTRGIERVTAEWRWICAGYSLRRLVNLMARKSGGSLGPGSPEAAAAALSAAVWAISAVFCKTIPLATWIRKCFPAHQIRIRRCMSF